MGIAEGLPPPGVTSLIKWDPNDGQSIIPRLCRLHLGEQGTTGPGWRPGVLGLGRPKESSGHVTHTNVYSKTPVTALGRGARISLLVIRQKNRGKTPEIVLSGHKNAWALLKKLPPTPAAAFCQKSSGCSQKNTAPRGLGPGWVRKHPGKQQGAEDTAPSPAPGPQQGGCCRDFAIWTCPELLGGSWDKATSFFPLLGPSGDPLPPPLALGKRPQELEAVPGGEGGHPVPLGAKPAAPFLLATAGERNTARRR